MTDLFNEEKYDHVSFVDLHIFIPKGEKYAIEKIKKLLDIYDDYIYQLRKIDERKIMSNEEKECTVEFINLLKKQKETEVGTFVERMKR